MRKYNISELELLQNKTKIIKNYGVDIIVKPSPGEERPGYIDPAEFKMMDSNWATQEEGELVVSVEEQVSEIRESMGFPNYNLNTVEIHTKYEEITSSGNNVGVWRYYPRKSTNNKKTALVFFHGGGWMGGSTYTVENVCKLISELADAVVFNVDYSLAPEKKYPNGLNDNYEAVKHVYNNAEKYGIDPEKICIGGDSAGGNFTAAISLKARDLGTPKIAVQFPIYPAIAMADVSIDGYKWSEDEFVVSDEHAKIIKKNLLNLGRPEKVEESLFLKLYINNEKEINDPYVSPILAKSFKGLPKAVLFGAEFDGLRIHTEFYAKLLKDAGVDVTCYRYKGLPHAFMDKLGHLSQVEDVCIEIARVMREL